MSDEFAHLRCIVIVPAFNERRAIASVVAQLHRFLPGFDVLVVDDGSTDGTASAVPASAKLIRLPFNLGIGGAMQTGYRFAALNGYDVAVQVDGDGQHRARDGGRLVRHLLATGADMVIGSRFLKPNMYRQTVTRRCGIWVLRSLIRVLCGQRITDCTSGFRAINRRVIHAFAAWYPDDYPEPEVVMLMRRCGFKIEELSVRMKQRRSGRSSISRLTGLFYVCKVSVALLLDVARLPWTNVETPHDSLAHPVRPGK